MRRQEHTIPPSLAGNCHFLEGGHEAQNCHDLPVCSCYQFSPGCPVLSVVVPAPGAEMTNMIPVTVIEHAGPFPPSMEGVYLTYQGQSLEQAAAEFIRRTKTKPSIIYMDAKRQTVEEGK